jgi:hypothetical protein
VRESGTPRPKRKVVFGTADSCQEPSEEEADLAYPTEERERAKIRARERKAAGQSPRTRRKKVEDHHDDCGTDLSGLGISESALADEMLLAVAKESEESLDNERAPFVPMWWLRGSTAAFPAPGPQTPQARGHRLCMNPALRVQSPWRAHRQHSDTASSQSAGDLGFVAPATPSAVTAPRSRAAACCAWTAGGGDETGTSAAIALTAGGGGGSMSSAARSMHTTTEFAPVLHLYLACGGSGGSAMPQAEITCCRVALYRPQATESATSARRCSSVPGSRPSVCVVGGFWNMRPGQLVMSVIMYQCLSNAYQSMLYVTP